MWMTFPLRPSPWLPSVMVHASGGDGDGVEDGVDAFPTMDVVLFWDGLGRPNLSRISRLDGSLIDVDVVDDAEGADAAAAVVVPWVPNRR